MGNFDSPQYHFEKYSNKLLFPPVLCFDEFALHFETIPYLKKPSSLLFGLMENFACKINKEYSIN